MWPLFLGTETPAPLMLPDSVQKAHFAETVHKIANLDFETVLQNLLSESVWILLKILLALAIYFVGRWILRRIVRLLDLALEHRRVDISLRSFMRNTVRVIFTLLLVLIVVSTLGVNVTSLIAVFSAATLAIGMALSGTAQNFAGGVMILLMKPYRVGDYISAQGQSGTVREIKLFSTVITTADNLHSEQLDRHGHHRQLFHVRYPPCGLDDRHFVRRRRGYGACGDPRHPCRR